MAEDTDGMEEALAGQIRVMVTAAGLAAEGIARARVQQQRRAQAASEQEARELESRLASEQRAARVELNNVHRPEWWSTVTPEQIGHAYQVARAWAREDPEAVRAEQRMRDELRDRYGIDVASMNADPAAVRAAVFERAEQDRARAGGERTDADADRAEAHLLLSQAEQQDRRAGDARRAAEHEPDPDERDDAAAEATELGAEGARDAGRALYDSAERREGSARELEAQGLGQEAVAAKMYADVSQAKPATEAVKGDGPRRAPKARKTRSRSVEVQRAGVER